MDKVAMYKEEIYKQAGVKNFFKNYKNLMSGATVHKAERIRNKAMGMSALDLQRGNKIMGNLTRNGTNEYTAKAKELFDVGDYSASREMLNKAKVKSAWRDEQRDTAKFYADKAYRNANRARDLSNKVLKLKNKRDLAIGTTAAGAYGAGLGLSVAAHKIKEKNKK